MRGGKRILVSAAIRALLGFANSPHGTVRETLHEKADRNERESLLRILSSSSSDKQAKRAQLPGR